MKITKKKAMAEFFRNPRDARQRLYEAVRALAVDGLESDQAADRFGYSTSSLEVLVRKFQSGAIELFPRTERKPKSKKISGALQRKLVRLRNRGLSAREILVKLNDGKPGVSIRSVERVLAELGFPKLHRRSNRELGISRKNTIIPEVSAQLGVDTLEKFSTDCPVAGVFFFLPYIIESGIMDIVAQCRLPESGAIGSVSAGLSMLLLKLLGQERLSHIGQYDRETGFGVFAGLNVLPKPTYMSTYSCRCSEEMLLGFQQRIVSVLNDKYPDIYSSGQINLDFHSIPHYGEESEMEKVWCGSRGKAMKGANTVFAQDCASNALVYTRTEIKRSEEAGEVKKFVEHWRSIKGDIADTLVFDCKFTTYSMLDDLTDDGIKFITLRRRHENLLRETDKIQEENWQKVYLPIPKRKRKRVSVIEETVRIRDCRNAFRQITVKDHGRANPTYILMNDFERPVKDVLIVYAKRWHVEQKLAEIVSFFNLNALSSPVMIRIHFDILWTLIADTLYHRLAADLKRFEKCLAPTIFKRFVNMPGKVVFDGSNFQIRIRKRAHTPVLLGVEKLNRPIHVPWLGNRTVEIIWTA